MADRQAGFTLLELIVALTILGIGLAVLVGDVDDGSRAARLAARQREATAAARSILAELGRSTPLADGESDGVLADGFQWHLAVAPFGTGRSGPPPPLLGHDVTLTISWRQGGRVDRLRFRTLLLGPG